MRTMDDIEDLIAFLLARIAEEEADPTRFAVPLPAENVRDWCEQRRRSVIRYRTSASEEGEDTLRMWATAYHAHPDYRREWLPRFMPPDAKIV